MDEFASVMMLLLVFIAYVQGILWLAIGGLILLLLFTKNILAFIVSLGGIAVIELLQMQEYWFIVLFLAAAVILIGKYREGEEDYYSAEMLDMLDEY